MVSSLRTKSSWIVASLLSVAGSVLLGNFSAVAAQVIPTSSLVTGQLITPATFSLVKVAAPSSVRVIETYISSGSNTFDGVKFNLSITGDPAVKLVSKSVKALPDGNSELVSMDLYAIRMNDMSKIDLGNVRTISLWVNRRIDSSNSGSWELLREVKGKVLPLSMDRCYAKQSDGTIHIQFKRVIAAASNIGSDLNLNPDLES